MVSTRGPKTRYFEKGEKVLCYEPDPSKAKVLYNSKILGIHESRDKRGRKLIQYKVHFQGWSSSWDRKVNADFVLKDTEENRQLQRDLAEKAQLQLGAYLYRKERNANKKRNRRSAANSEDSADASNSPIKLRERGLSDDNFSSSSTFEKQDDSFMKDDCETDSCCSSLESTHDEDRVMLRISERLRQYLEYDYDMVVKHGKQHTLPVRISAVAILENFVKQTSIKMILSTTQVDSTRRRNTQQRNDKKEKEFDKMTTMVGLLKEVADGLRIYLDFTISEYLLYKEEKEYALSYLSEENLRNFTYVPASTFSVEMPWFNIKNDMSDMQVTTTGNLLYPALSDHIELGAVTTNCTTIATTILTTTTTNGACTVDSDVINSGTIVATSVITSTLAAVTVTTTAVISGIPAIHEEQPQRRKLRSHRSDDNHDLKLENCFTSSGTSTPLSSTLPNLYNLNCLKSSQLISPQIRDFVQQVISWRLLPSNASPAPSMIFGAPHLARLLVKLPEFLNASSMTDEKLKVLLQHLDTFINYLESHKDWFTEDNYSSNPVAKKCNSVKSNNGTATITKEIIEQEQKEREEQKKSQIQEYDLATNAPAMITKI